MRISDWSSDVCSSDLIEARHLCHLHGQADAGTGGLGDAHPPVRRRYRDGPQRLLQCRRLAIAGILPFHRRDAEIPAQGEIGRASCRERVCQYVDIWVGAVDVKKKVDTKTIKAD